MLVTADEVETAANKYVDPLDWAFERDQFLLAGNPSRFCPSREAIVLIENEEVTVPGTNLTFNMMVIENLWLKQIGS